MDNSASDIWGVEATFVASSDIKETKIDYSWLTVLEDSLPNIDKIVRNPRRFIVQEEDVVIGYIYYSDIYDRAEINQFEVEFSHRNCGKGKKLLNKMLELVDKSITLEVKIDNFPAIHLYEKYGFERKAIRKGYYNGIDGILMERNNEK